MAAAPLTSTAELLRAALKKGLPTTPESLPCGAGDLPSVRHRCELRPSDSEVAIAFDSVIRMSIRRLSTPNRVRSARVLFGSHRSFRGKNLSERRAAAASILGYEVNHFRLRVERSLLDELGHLIDSDGLRIERGLASGSRSAALAKESYGGGTDQPPQRSSPQAPMPTVNAATNLRHGSSLASPTALQERIVTTADESDSDRFTFLVMSADKIFAHGLAEVLTKERSAAFVRHHPDLDNLDRFASPCLAVIDPRNPLDDDPLSAAEAITRRLSHDGIGDVVVVADGHLGPIPTLRLVEAGARFLLTRHELSFSPAGPADALETLDPEFRLPTRWELRESLGLAWDGDIGHYLDAVRDLRPHHWAPTAAASSLTRREVMRVRRLAKDLAGMPAPDYRNYAMSFRASPDTPEWRDVRRFTLDALGLPPVSAR